MNLVIVIVISYLFGSIPFGYLIAKGRKIDIRKTGSGNIGATNVYRALGFRFAIIVGLLDIAKGFVPTLLASLLFANQILIATIAFAAFLGHLFPVFLHFKGGKGVATFGGTLLVIMGIKLFLVVFIIWLAVLYATRIMSLTILSMSFLIPLIFLFVIGSIPYTIYSLVICLFIWFTHRANIQRLRNGTEKKLSLLK